MPHLPWAAAAPSTLGKTALLASHTLHKQKVFRNLYRPTAAASVPKTHLSQGRPEEGSCVSAMACRKFTESRRSSTDNHFSQSDNRVLTTPPILAVWQAPQTSCFRHHYSFHTVVLLVGKQGHPTDCSGLRGSVTQASVRQ